LIPFFAKINLKESGEEENVSRVPGDQNKQQSITATDINYTETFAK